MPETCSLEAELKCRGFYRADFPHGFQQLFFQSMVPVLAWDGGEKQDIIAINRAAVLFMKKGLLHLFIDMHRNRVYRFNGDIDVRDNNGVYQKVSTCTVGKFYDDMDGICGPHLSHLEPVRKTLTPEKWSELIKQGAHL